MLEYVYVKFEPKSCIWNLWMSNWSSRTCSGFSRTHSWAPIRHSKALNAWFWLKLHIYVLTWYKHQITTSRSPISQINHMHAPILYQTHVQHDKFKHSNFYSHGLYMHVTYNPHSQLIWWKDGQIHGFQPKFIMSHAIQAQICKFKMITYKHASIDFKFNKYNSISS